jgi:hypothetical protein
VIFAQPTLILPERDVKHPMQGVLDAPMAAYRACEELHLGSETIEVVVDLGAWLRIPDVPLADDHAEAAQANPLRMPVCKAFRQGQHLVLPSLLAAMLFFIGLVAMMFYPRKIVLQTVDKRLLHVRMDGLLIAFQGQHLVGARGVNLGGKRFLTAPGVNGDDGSLQLEDFQECGDGGDLVRLAVHRTLAEH